MISFNSKNYPVIQVTGAEGGWVFVQDHATSKRQKWDVRQVFVCLFLLHLTANTSPQNSKRALKICPMEMTILGDVYFTEIL